MAKPGTGDYSNVSADLWAEALAVYTADKGVVDRANGQLRKHQLAYENQGIAAKQVRERYKEAQLTEEERLQLYADEHTSRRALDLWSAESPEDFEHLMERAASTEPATGQALDKLAAARAYNDGNNSARFGGSAAEDNPHTPGSSEHQQWALGWVDGVDEAVRTQVAALPPPVEPPQSPRRRGTPRKIGAAATAPPEPAEEPANGLFPETSVMPELPGVPV